VRRVRLRVLSEAECYARCYGGYEHSVDLIDLDRVKSPRRPFESTLSGEEVRRLFELRLDARDPELQPKAA
jgi:hypothetical protein